MRAAHSLPASRRAFPYGPADSGRGADAAFLLAVGGGRCGPAVALSR
jgi:hypothetical protein